MAGSVLAYCGHTGCGNKASIVCRGCDSIKYCSDKCLQMARKTHEVVCASLADSVCSGSINFVEEFKPLLAKQATMQKMIKEHGSRQQLLRPKIGEYCINRGNLTRNRLDDIINEMDLLITCKQDLLACSKESAELNMKIYERIRIPLRTSPKILQNAVAIRKQMGTFQGVCDEAVQNHAFDLSRYNDMSGYLKERLQRIDSAFATAQ